MNTNLYGISKWKCKMFQTVNKVLFKTLLIFQNVKIQRLEDSAGLSLWQSYPNLTQFCLIFNVVCCKFFKFWQTLFTFKLIHIGSEYLSSGVGYENVDSPASSSIGEQTKDEIYWLYQKLKRVSPHDRNLQNQKINFKFYFKKKLN